MEIKLKPGNTKNKISQFPPAIASYYKYVYKVSAKYTGINRPNYKKKADYSGIIPVNGHDICNYVARYDMANFQIQAIMKLDGKLDFDKLVKQ